MLGCYDFCGHYEWTFEWLRERGGDEFVKAYWKEAIFVDSQRHATETIVKQGIAGMETYWGHTLQQEGAGFRTTSKPDVFRIDMHACPSKGFLLHNGLNQYRDYCDHCIGWIGPMMEQAGFVIDHEHNHCGQCWWEMRRRENATKPSQPGELSGAYDVRMHDTWVQPPPVDQFVRATSADGKHIEAAP